jgi:membrane bound O-acyltransferase family protein
MATATTTRAASPAALAPLLLLPVCALLLGPWLAPWVFMWVMAWGLYAGCKWFTYRDGPSRAVGVGPARSLGYLFAWPGMDAAAFIRPRRTTVTPPSRSEWAAAVAKTLLGCVLTWGVARIVLPSHVLAAGWIGMIGLIFVLHFGTFHLLSLVWRSRGVEAMPLMRNPLRSISLGEFWGRRWNTAFHALAARLVFRPLQNVVGTRAASLLVFLTSGLIHELVISVPARGGYGLPTGYFLLQGAGVAVEHTRWGREVGLGRGPRGRLFTIVVAAGPAFWLFPPPFIHHVIVPMLTVIGAL